MNEIQFYPDTHQYFVDGVEYPSVTTILAPIQLFDFVNKDVLARAAEFGNHVHQACEMHDKGTLHEASLHPALVPFLDGWKKFIFVMSPIFNLIESKVFSKKYGYAGTLDRVLVLGGKTVLVDIKTGVESPSFGPQTAAYRQAVEEMTAMKIHKRFTVQLSPGDYRLIEHKSKNDFNIFMSCLNVHNFNKNFKR